MALDKNKIIEYPFPYKQHSRLKPILCIGYIMMSLLFLIFFIMPIEEGIIVIIFRIIGPFYSLFFLFLVLHDGIFKKSYVELTQDHIKIKSVFRKKIIKWEEIHDIQIYSKSTNTFLGIVLKEKIKKRKDSFLTLLNDLYVGNFSVQISFSNFPDIDVQRLYFTMHNKIIEVIKQTHSNNEINADNYSVDDNNNSPKSNYFVALIKCSLVSIILGILYGLSIFILNLNIIFIPIIGSIAVIYFYHKSYKEENINFIIRIIVGLICAAQTFVGMLTLVFLSAKLPLTLQNIRYITTEYFKELISNPFEQAHIILIALIIFIYGSMQNYEFKFQKWLGKLTMKKAGKYYYKRNGKLAYIYLIDPVHYDDDDDGKLMGSIWKDCLIEKDKKSIKAFYIPSHSIEELGCSISYDSIVAINNISYLKLDLGSTGSPQQYVFPCGLIVGKDKKVQLLELQL